MEPQHRRNGASRRAAVDFGETVVDSGAIRRGSEGSLESIATRRFNFTAKPREALAQTDRASVVSLPSLHRESPEPPSGVSRASTLAPLDDTRASVDLQLSWLKIGGSIFQLRSKEESFAPKLGRMDRVFHEHLPEARLDRGRSGEDLPKLSRASEGAFVSSRESELHCRDFSRSSCHSFPSPKTDRPRLHGLRVRSETKLARFATSCSPLAGIRTPDSDNAREIQAGTGRADPRPVRGDSRVGKAVAAARTRDREVRAM
jgi:hypothetical protein